MCGEELGGRWRVCSGSSGPEVVPRGKRKEGNKSDLFWLRLFFSIWDGMRDNRFVVHI